MRNFGIIVLVLGIFGFFYASGQEGQYEAVPEGLSIHESWSYPAGRWQVARYASAEGPQHGVMHAVTNPWIRLDAEDRARGRWYLLDLHTTPGVENPLILFGIYDDLYHKVAGRWLIHRTRIDFLWPRRDYVGPREA